MKKQRVLTKTETGGGKESSSERVDPGDRRAGWVRGRGGGEDREAQVR